MPYYIVFIIVQVDLFCRPAAQLCGNLILAYISKVFRLIIGKTVCSREACSSLEQFGSCKRTNMAVGKAEHRIAAVAGMRN